MLHSSCQAIAIIRFTMSSLFCILPFLSIPLQLALSFLSPAKPLAMPPYLGHGGGQRVGMGQLIRRGAAVGYGQRPSSGFPTGFDVGGAVAHRQSARQAAGLHPLPDARGLRYSGRVACALGKALADAGGFTYQLQIVR